MAGSLDASQTSTKREQPVRPRTLDPMTEGVSEETRERVVVEEIAKQEEEREEEEDGENESEEARRAKPYNNPKNPTKAEVMKHELTHLPFRNWCRFCVRGKSSNSQHRKHQEPGNEIRNANRN